MFNGLKKIDSSELNFMTELNIRRVMSTIKIKNCEGWDRIPQRIFVEGIEVLAAPLTNLFNKNVLLTDMSSLRVGKNILSNRLSIISNKVDLSWLNQSYETYKVNCKRLLMT